MPAAQEGEEAAGRVVTPEPPEVATGEVTQGWCEFGAWDWAPVTAAGRGALALARAKYPAVTAVAATSAAAVQFDSRRTRRMPSSLLAALVSSGDGPPGPGSGRLDDGC